MADYKKGDRVLVHGVDDKGKVLRRMWFVATIISVGRGSHADTYRVRYDDGGMERVPKADVYGTTPVKRKRKTAIKGKQIDEWKPEFRETFTRVKKDRRRTGLTARQMLNATPANIKTNSAYVSVERREMRKKKERGPGGEELWVQLTRTKTAPAEPGDPARRHYQRIDVLEPGVKDITRKNTRLKVSCDCESFMYMAEVALNRYGAADIIYSNGEKPRVTNPKMVPLVCKHLNLLLGG